MKSLFVPQPLVAAFRASANEWGIWLQPGLLKRIVSPQDVAFYIMANAQSEQLVGSDFAVSFPNLLLEMGIGPNPNWPGDESDDRAIQRAWSSMAQSPSAPTKLMKPADDMAPSVLKLDDQLLIYTLADRGEQTDAWYELLARIHPFYTFETLAGLPVFAQYLKHRTSVGV
jgi:hypothetical protein